VCSYFQVLALFKSFQMKGASYYIIQELQTIKFIKQHASIIKKLIKFVKLSTWWLPQTSGTHIWKSRRFESMYTLQGKIWPTRHMHPTLSPRMVPDHTYLTWSMHSNLSRSHQQRWIEPLILRKKAPDTIHTTMANRSVGLYSVSLPSQPLKQWG
jgi:hypothetical protein